MMIENLCPEIHYQKTEKGLILTGCYGVDGKIVLPDKIEGIPIVGIAPYAFSEGKEFSEDFIWLSEDAMFFKERRRLKTAEVTEVRLPFGIHEIGKYAFYRCRNLQKLILSDEILEIGGGALTGCRGIREVEIHFENGECSALKSILDEVRFQVHVRLYMGDKVADILFPEHYEEAVEDTPAKQLFTRYHGAGGDYRQCFYNRELDYKKYDELLYRAVAEDTVETVANMALGRLMFPYKLSEEAKKKYRNYLQKNLLEIMSLLTEKEEYKKIRFLIDEKMISEEAFLSAIEYATKHGKTEILSVLMNEKRKAFPKKKKSFDL